MDSNQAVATQGSGSALDEFKPLRLNEAQRLLVSLGMHDLRLFAGNRGRQPSFTKTGPGRKHQHGKHEGEQQ